MLILVFITDSSVRPLTSLKKYTLSTLPLYQLHFDNVYQVYFIERVDSWDLIIFHVLSKTQDNRNVIHRLNQILPKSTLAHHYLG